MANTMIPVLKDRIAEMIRREIFTDNMKDGDELKQEEVSELLGVSRMPVREAFQQLVSEGILIRHKNRHVTVVGVTEKRLREMFCGLCSLEKSFISGIKEISLITEAFNAYEDVCQTCSDDTWLQAVIDFQLSISRALDNPYLHQLHKKMVMAYPAFLYSRGTVDRDKALSLHARIYNAIYDRDTEGCRKALEDYYQYIVTIAIKEHDFEQS